MTRQAPDTHQSIKDYYRLHSRFYDVTRWIFLFGRSQLIEQIVARSSPKRILEIGCGTGANLTRLVDVFPGAEVTGLDLSKDMLDRAGRKLLRSANRVRLIPSAYDEPLGEPFELVMFSYSLSMFNPGWERALECARRDLVPGGHIAVVDFHDTPFTLFSSWMEANHVRLGGHLLHELERAFATRSIKIARAFWGIWRYFLYVGENDGRRAGG